MLVFAADVDGDGVRDGVAWVASHDALGGRLLYYKGGAAGAAPAAPKQLAALPGGLIGLAGCAAEPHSRKLDRRRWRSASMPPAIAPPGATKVRWVAVAGPARSALREEITSPIRRQVQAEPRARCIDVDAIAATISGAYSLEGAPHRSKRSARDGRFTLARSPDRSFA